MFGMICLSRYVLPPVYHLLRDAQRDDKKQV